jgi:hypothetical protein
METQNEWHKKLIELFKLQDFLQIIKRDGNGNPITLGNPEFPNTYAMKLAENENGYEEIYNREQIKYDSTDLEATILIKENISSIIDRHREINPDSDQNKKFLRIARSFIKYLNTKITTKESKTFYKNQHPTMFTNDGFELFEYILNNHITSNRGRINDISFYYWKMFEDKLIIQRPFAFVKWFVELYNVEDFQIKTLPTVHNLDRLKHYSNSLDWFKHRNP